MVHKKVNKQQTEKLLTIKEAAELLKVSEVTVKRYVSKEVIPSMKIGGARRIIKNDIWDSFIDKIRVEHNGKANIVAESETPFIAKREIRKEEKKIFFWFNNLTPNKRTFRSNLFSQCTNANAEKRISASIPNTKSNSNFVK